MTTNFGMRWCVVAYCATVLISIGTSRAIGETFYVDPAAGSSEGDGSESRPWRTLEEVFANDLIETRQIATPPYAPDAPLVTKNAGAPVKAGDTIVLLSGYHGEIFETGAYNEKTITLEAGKGQTPTLGSIRFRSAAKWRLRGLTVSPELASEFDARAIVIFESHNYHGPSTHFTIEDSNIYSVDDTTKWSTEDWNTRAADGIACDGSDFVIRNNRVKNIHFGVVAIGDDILAESNAIDNYSADGMRGGGDRVTFQGNTIQWSYKVDDNHDDAIQFYRSDRKACRDVVIRGNTIKSYSDPARPLVHAGQGLGMFNGPYVNWIVENNVVMVAHYHGITLVDAEDTRIVNNTVLDITGNYEPWIQLKNSKNCTVRNNLAMTFRIGEDKRWELGHNIALTSDALSSCFVDWQNGDLRIKVGSDAIDTGTSTTAPARDIEGRPRPIGAGVDVGAYEFVPHE